MMGPAFYDEVFRAKRRYLAPWNATAQTHVFRAARAMIDAREAVLEVGCGTGQFAQCLAEQCQASYLGVDFSPVAIQQACRRVPTFLFACQDVVLRPPDYGGWDVVVALEVLEHLEDDRSFLQVLPAGMKVVFSLPTFGGPSHERHFTSEAALVSYYAGVLRVERLERVENFAKPGTFPWWLGLARRS